MSNSKKYTVMKQNNEEAYGYMEFCVDAAADIAYLPKQPFCATGSVCICIATSDVYMLDSKGKWGKL